VEPEGDLEIRLGEVPEVTPWGLPGFVVTSADGTPDYQATMEAMFAHREGVILEGIREHSEDRARSYLSSNGDAVWRRVDPLLVESAALLPDHPGASLTVCLTAAEIVIRFLLVRPLIGGLVVNDVVAERLSKEGASGRSKRDREMLPLLNAAWKLGLERLRLKDGRSVWPLMLQLWDMRDDYVHRADPVPELAARDAMHCVDKLIGGVVGPLAQRLELHWPESHWLEPWDKAADPFDRPSKRSVSAAS
jgi:hypothetical protein